jgi:hypothetical protein
VSRVRSVRRHTTPPHPPRPHPRCPMTTALRVAAQRRPVGGARLEGGERRCGGRHRGRHASGGRGGCGGVSVNGAGGGRGESGDSDLTRNEFAVSGPLTAPPPAPPTHTASRRRREELGSPVGGRDHIFVPTSRAPGPGESHAPPPSVTSSLLSPCATTDRRRAHVRVTCCRDDGLSAGAAGAATPAAHPPRSLVAVAMRGTAMGCCHASNPVIHNLWFQRYRLPQPNTVPRWSFRSTRREERLPAPARGAGSRNPTPARPPHPCPPPVPDPTQHRHG